MSELKQTSMQVVIKLFFSPLVGGWRGPHRTFWSHQQCMVHFLGYNHLECALIPFVLSSRIDPTFF